MLSCCSSKGYPYSTSSSALDRDIILDQYHFGVKFQSTPVDSDSPLFSPCFFKPVLTTLSLPGVFIISSSHFNTHCHGLFVRRKSHFLSFSIKLIKVAREAWWRKTMVYWKNKTFQTKIFCVQPRKVLQILWWHIFLLKCSQIELEFLLGANSPWQRGFRYSWYWLD